MVSVADNKLVPGPQDLDDAQDLYMLDSAELDFLSDQTGIKDRNQLKEHLLEIRKELYAVRLLS
jgi:hypothetical protein